MEKEKLRFGLVLSYFGILVILAFVLGGCKPIVKADMPIDAPVDIAGQLKEIKGEVKLHAAAIAGVNNSVQDLKVSAGRDVFYNDPQALQVMVVGLIVIIASGIIAGAAVLFAMFLLIRKVIRMFVKSRSKTTKMIMAMANSLLLLKTQKRGGGKNGT